MMEYRGYQSEDVFETLSMDSVETDMFRQALDNAQKWADAVGYTVKDVNDLVKAVRAKKHGNMD